MTYNRVGDPQLQSFHISFCSDLTRSNSPSFPLAYLLEATWGDDARWLGLIGRHEIEMHEKALVNFNNWPELLEPSKLMSDVFECGWEGDWGAAASHVSERWRASALVIETLAPVAMHQFQQVEDDAIWELAKSWLGTTLLSYSKKLIALPVPPDNIVPLPRKSRRSISEDFQSRGSKMANAA